MRFLITLFLASHSNRIICFAEYFGWCAAFCHGTLRRILCWPHGTPSRTTLLVSSWRQPTLIGTPNSRRFPCARKITWSASTTWGRSKFDTLQGKGRMIFVIKKRSKFRVPVQWDVIIFESTHLLCKSVLKIYMCINSFMADLTFFTVS